MSGRVNGMDEVTKITIGRHVMIAVVMGEMETGRWRRTTATKPARTASNAMLL